MASLTTLVAVIGEGAAQLLGALSGRAANLSVEPVAEVPAAPIEGFAVIGPAWRRAAGHGSIYTLIDADPIQPVVRHWASRLRGEPHDLEVAIGAATGAATPDYYLVSPNLADPEVHWYQGLLRDLSPARVVAVELRPEPVLHALASLGAGPPLPAAADLAGRAREWIPLPKVSV